MRKKMTIDEKKVSFGISLDPNLYKILKEYTMENKIKVSRFIENILKQKLNINNGK